MLDIAKVLKRRMGAEAKRVPTRELPNWLMGIAALRDPTVKALLPQLGKIRMPPAKKPVVCSVACRVRTKSQSPTRRRLPKAFRESKPRP